MKTLRLFAAWSCLTASLWAAPPVLNEAVLPEAIFPDLDVILKQAVLQSPVMLNRALDLEMAENTRIAARAALLPSAGGYYNFNRSKDTTDFVYNIPALDNRNTYWTNTNPYAFSISQPLFAWGERRNIAKIGEIQQTIIRGQYKEGYRMFAQNLRTDYMRLIVLKLAAKRAAFYLDFCKNQQVLEEARFEKKIIADMQMAAVRLRTQQAQLASEQADFNFENGKISFARLSGSPLLADDAIPNTMPVIPYTAAAFDQLLSGFLAQKEPPTTEAVSARRALEVEKLNYANIKTRLRPKVMLNTGATQTVQSNLYGSVDTYQLTSLYAGVGVNWSIFDGFASGAYARNSLARRRQLERDYKVMTERLAQQAQMQVKQLNFAARSMAMSDRGFSDTAGGYRDKQNNFSRGDASEADVSYARIGLYDAEMNAYNNRIEYMGRIGDFLGTVMEDPVLANVADKQ